MNWLSEICRDLFNLCILIFFGMLPQFCGTSRGAGDLKPVKLCEFLIISPIEVQRQDPTEIRMGTHA